MKTAVVHAYDAPPAYTDFPAPEAQPGEMLVQVSAAGLHPIVRAIANGSHYTATGRFPFVPGVDGVGRDALGDRYYFGAGRPPYGTFAEQTIASPLFRVRLPDSIDDVTAAGICNPAMSGWAALDRGGFQAGDSVLILGATGNAGRMATQIARRRGAKHVTVAGRNPAALAELTSLGADRAISLEQPGEALKDDLRTARNEFGFNVVLDYIWGPAAEAAISVITERSAKYPSPQTRYVQIGNSAAPTISLPAAALRSSDLHLLGSGFGSASFEALAAAVQDFFHEAARQPFVFETKAVPLSEIEGVWQARQSSARIVFTF